jgi:hypothetical protein
VTDQPADPERAPDEVKDRVEEIQRRHRSKIRWRISKHTAELAIKAIESSPEPSPRRKNGKSRRRKRRKRLL